MNQTAENFVTLTPAADDILEQIGLTDAEVVERLRPHIDQPGTYAAGKYIAEASGTQLIARVRRQGNGWQVKVMDGAEAAQQMPHETHEKLQ